jgi:hypothetical protein
MAVKMSFLDFITQMNPGWDFAFFQKLIGQMFDRCLDHDPDAPNVMIWMPTGYSKSWLLQMLAAYILARSPAAKLIIGTNSDLLANEDAHGVLNILRSQAFAENYYKPEFTKEGAANFQLVQGGGLHAASLSGQQLGWRADAYILDDPTRNIADAWAPGQAAKLRTAYQSGPVTRLTPGAPVFAAMQRLKTDDLGGWLREQAYQNPLNQQWAIICLPMVATEKTPGFIEYTKTRHKDFLPLYRNCSNRASSSHTRRCVSVRAIRVWR